MHGQWVGMQLVGVLLMTTRIWLVSLLLSLGIGALAPASPLHAQAAPNHARDSEARALFDAGRAAMADGRYEDALDYFQRAHELSPRPLMLFNIGAVSERLRLHEKALSSYRQYLEQLPEADNRVEVERRIELLEQDLARERALAEAANASEASSEPDPSSAEERRWWKNPWLWTAVGVVVVGASVGAGVAASGGSAGVEEPLPGTTGGVTTTLTQRF